MHIHKIIIFIHGSLFFIPSWQSLKKAWLTTPEEQSFSWYQRYKNALRFNTIFKYQPIDACGLHQIIEDEKSQEYPSVGRSLTSQWYQATDRLMNKSLQENETTYSFYTFGWNGNVDKKDRENAAHQLYESLIEMIKKEKLASENLNSARGKPVEPYERTQIELTIAGHSHGGNVALNIALMEKRLQKKLQIDNLILLGTPVQSETAGFIHDPLFKNIYHVYSAGDFVQKADIFSTDDPYSQRKFEKNKKALPLPKNLTQIEVKIDHKKPAHAELWMFGTKKNFLYRKKLSISPLPVVVFTPAIVHALNHTLIGTSQVSVNLCKKENKYHFEFYKDKIQPILHENKPYSFELDFDAKKTTQ